MACIRNIASTSTQITLLIEDGTGTCGGALSLSLSLSLPLSLSLSHPDCASREATLAHTPREDRLLRAGQIDARLWKNPNEEENQEEDFP